MINEYLSTNKKSENIVELIDYYSKSQMELQILESVSFLHNKIKDMLLVEKKISRVHYIAFSLILYLVLYERIGFTLNEIANVVCIKRKRDNTKIPIIIETIIKEKEIPSFLFDGMKNHIRNSIAHGTYIINDKEEKILIKDYEVEFYITFDELNHKINQLRLLIFSIYFDQIEVFKNQIITSRNV